MCGIITSWVVSVYIFDVEVFLHRALFIVEERKRCGSLLPIVVGGVPVVSGDDDDPECNRRSTGDETAPVPIVLTVLRTEEAPRQHQNHKLVALQIGEASLCLGVVGKTVIRKDGSGYDVQSHECRDDSISMEKLMLQMAGATDQYTRKNLKLTSAGCVGSALPSSAASDSHNFLWAGQASIGKASPRITDRVACHFARFRDIAFGQTMTGSND